MCTSYSKSIQKKVTFKEIEKVWSEGRGGWAKDVSKWPNLFTALTFVAFKLSCQDLVFFFGAWDFCLFIAPNGYLYCHPPMCQHMKLNCANIFPRFELRQVTSPSQTIAFQLPQSYMNMKEYGWTTEPHLTLRRPGNRHWLWNIYSSPSR